MPADTNIEHEIQAQGLTAPRVTPDQVEAKIAAAFYFTARQGNDGATTTGQNFSNLRGNASSDACLKALGLLTICVLVLTNGFTVTGESACVSPENFDAQLGRKIAFQHARDKIWALEGYALRERLAAHQ